MRRIATRRLLAVAPATVLVFAAPAAADTRSLTAPVGSTKGSALLPYLERENVTAGFLALQQQLQMESR